jgi:ATP-dependent Clp protease ATP-binding subunit ClpA
MKLNNHVAYYCFFGCQITQQEFTEMAWQSIVLAPEVAKESKHQIVETEHLMKSLLEQRNGLARRIFSKAGVDNTRLLDATEKYIQRQPKVIYPKNTHHLILFYFLILTSLCTLVYIAI